MAGSRWIKVGSSQVTPGPMCWNLFCYSTKAVQAPTGVLNTLECVGFPRQQASLPSLELICGAMKQFPSFQEFLQDTKFERQMEGQELWGIVLHAVAQTYFPL